jgi:hypothetical protein
LGEVKFGFGTPGGRRWDLRMAERLEDYDIAVQKECERERGARSVVHSPGTSSSPFPFDTHPASFSLAMDAPSSSPSRTLDSLPEDILHLILGHVFSDPAPQASGRTSVLLVCRALHDASIVHLYRRVRCHSLSSWETLFGISLSGLGVLTSESGRDRGRYVHELSLSVRKVDFERKRGRGTFLSDHRDEATNS